MSNIIDMEKAKDILGGFTSQAQDMLKDGSKVEGVLESLEAKLKEIPAVGEGVAKLPLMISMIRAYITKEYTEVSPKVVASMLCAALYLLKGKDLVRDSLPVVGYLDDIAVLGAAIKLSEKELDDYAAWRETKTVAAEEPAEAEETATCACTETVEATEA